MTNAEWVSCALSVLPRENWYGAIYLRPQSIEPFGTYHGGTHPYDHPSIFAEGVFLVRIKRPSGEILERSYRVPRFGHGIVNIKKGEEHDVVNLTAERLHWLCASLQADNNGEIREQVFHEELAPHG